MSSRWHNRVALVTGASSGIGHAIALQLATELGMRVALCARREDRLRALAEAIRERRPEAACSIHPCDLRDASAIDGMFADLRARYGGVDLLINNAGLGREAPLMSGSTEDWREMLELNVLALCICTREALTDMRRREAEEGFAGHVIHVSSMAGHRVPASGGVYPATKHAVRALIEGLRAELRACKSQIRVGAISPGYVETEFAKVYTHGDEARARETYSRFVVLQSEDVARTVLHMVEAPPHVQIHDVLVRSTDQPL